MIGNRLGRGRVTAAAAVALLAAVTACSSSSKSSSPNTSGGSDTSSSSGGSSASAGSLKAFEAKVAADVTKAKATQTQSAPASGPKGAEGKTIIMVPPAGASTEGGYRTALAAQDAAKALGWKTLLINPEGDPSKMNAAVQKAIAIKADGIAIVSIDAGVVQNALNQAKKAGIKVVGSIAANSNGDTGIFQSLVPSLASGEQNGYVLGEETYLQTKGHIRAVELMDSEFGYVVARQKGWNKFIADCQAAGGDCKTLSTTNFLAADIQTKLPGLTAQTLRAHPDFNVLWSGFDSGLTFMIQGAQQAGLVSGKSFAVGFDGNTPNLDTIRKGGYERATVGLSTMWIGYAMIDNMNRLFAGQPTLTGDQEGIKNKLLVKDNVPTSGPWWGDKDVRAEYWKVWGVTPTSPAKAQDL